MPEDKPQCAGEALESQPTLTLIMTGVICTTVLSTGWVALMGEVDWRFWGLAPFLQLLVTMPIAFVAKRLGKRSIQHRVVTVALTVALLGLAKCTTQIFLGVGLEGAP